MPLAGLTALLLQYRYLILFPLACFEGPIAAFVVGMLAAQGYFSLLLVYPLFVLADIIPDMVYYGLGRYGSRYAFVARNAAKLGIAADGASVVRALWHEHTAKTMVMTKYAYGLSTPFLISAGMVKLPFVTFVLYSLTISIPTQLALLLLGYYFSGSFGLVSTALERVGIGVTLVIIFAVLYYYFTKYMRRQVFEEEQTEKRHEQLS